MASIYRSPESRTAILSLYDRQVKRLSFPVEDQSVDTRFGRTHLLLAGPSGAPPLVVLHGGNSTNPSSLDWIAPLVREFRIYAPDTIGLPGKSESSRLSPRNLSYGQWVADVLDGLQLPQAAVMGGSHGAGIALNTAVCAPDRISKLVLFIPSGFVSMPIGVMIGGFVIPLLRYQLAPTRRNLERVMAPMFAGSPFDEEALEMSEAVFRHVHVEPGMPRNVTRKDLQRLTAPVLVLAGERDRLFPPEVVIRRAQKVVPNLAAAEIIPDTPHYLTPAARVWLCNRVRQFLAED